MRVLEILKALAEQDLSVAEQVTLFRQINAHPLKGKILAESAAYFYRFLPQSNESPIKALDLVGTGGDGQGTFNISTTTALYLAQKGIPIAKHGSVSVSSQSGSVDCLHSLGIECAHDYSTAMQELKNGGQTFMFARDFYPVLGKFREARLALRDSGEKTIINLLGPLLNPLNPRYQVIGVYDRALLQPMAEAMQLLGREGFVVTSERTDELTLNPDHRILEVRDSGIHFKMFDLPALGFPYANINELKGGNPNENAAITRGILDGSITGPKRDVILANALLGKMAYGA